MTKQTKLAYLAGLVDGEGSFGIRVQEKEYKGRKMANFAVFLCMTLKDNNEVLDELKEIFGGHTYSYDSGRTRRWNLLVREDCERATKELLPYLRVKKDIAKRFLRALSYFPKSRKAHGKGQRSWTAEQVEKVGKIALTLNPSTARRTKLTVEDVKRLAETYRQDP